MLRAPKPLNQDFKEEFQVFLRHFRKDAARYGRPLEEALAESLQRLFLLVEIIVVIQQGNSNRVRAARSTDAGSTHSLTTKEARDALDAHVPSDFLLTSLPTFSRGVMRSTQGYVICLSASGQSGRPWKDDPARADFFWVLLPNIQDEQDIFNLQGLESNSEELGDLYGHLQATLNIARVPQFHLAAERLRQGRESLLSERLRSATKLILDIRPYLHPSTFRTIARGCDSLGRWVVQEVVGTGWSVSLGDGAIHRQDLQDFFDALKEIKIPLNLRTGPVPAGDPDSEYTQRFEAYELIACNQEGWINAKRIDLGRAATDHLSLLGRWTRLQRCCSELSRPTRKLRPVYEEAWAESVQLTLGPLKDLLARGWDWEEAPSETAQYRPRKLRGFSAWLTGWLATEMLSRMQPKAGEGGLFELGGLEASLLPSERWRLRSHLSLLVRESFRQVEFGDFPHFNFDSSSYLPALAGVVEHHAHGVIGVPREIDLQEILKTIGEARDADDYPFAASHLQHALQVYLAGHFFASLHLEGDSWKVQAGEMQNGQKPWTFLEAMAGLTQLRRGEQTLRELRQAFSLSALFHDTGMLLFPRVFFPAKELPRGDRLLKQRLDRVHQEVDHAAKDLMADCERELRENEYFDPVRERPLALWLQEEMDVGRHDHSLLGAWYLHRIASASQELSPDVVRQAVRAVLLHQVVTQSIDSARDPVSALLVLCDELMDWRPSEGPRGGLPIGLPVLGRRQLDVRPEGSRARQIRVQNLRCDRGAWILSLAQGKSWPVLEVQLQEPDHLTMPVYQTWLLIFENISRLSVNHPFGWMPTIDVISTVPGQLAALQTNHEELLGALARTTRLPFRTHLVKWLERIDVRRDPGKEHFRISPSIGDRWRESVLHSFEDLRKEIERIQLEIGHL